MKHIQFMLNFSGVALFAIAILITFYNNRKGQGKTAIKKQRMAF